MLIASQSSRVTLHHVSVNFILHGSCALGDGFHLYWGVLRAVHLRTLDNSSILVHVTNKFHETIHYHLLAVERKKNRLHKILFQNGKKAGTVLAWMYTFLLAMWSNQEANQGKLFTLKKINSFMVVNCSLLAIHMLMIINCSVQKFSLNKQRPLWQATFSIIGLRYLKEDEGVTIILSFSNVFFLSFLCFSVLFFLR